MNTLISTKSTHSKSWFVFLTFTFCFFLITKLFAQTGIAIPSMSHCDDAVEAFLDAYDIPGATLAIAKDGKLIYFRGFGTSDLAETEATQPYNIYRIASISKPNRARLSWSGKCRIITGPGHARRLTWQFPWRPLT